MASPIVKDLGDGALIIQTRAAWLAATLYAIADVARPTNGAFTGFEYVCNRDGYSGAAEPTWPTTLAGTVDDWAEDAWEDLTAYELNDYVVPTTYNGYKYICTRAGTSGGTEPVWPTDVDATIDDPDGGGAEWTCEALNGEADWTDLHGYILTDVVNPTTYNGFEYICTRAGTSGAVEPTWPTTIGNTVDDPDGGGAEWTCQRMAEIPAGWTCQAIAQGAEIKFINEGSVQWTEPHSDKMIYDRGVPDHRRRALPIEPMAISLGALYTRLKKDAGDSADSLYELITQTGAAAAYNSQSGTGEPYSVHLVIKVYDPALTKYEILEFPEFKENQTQVTEGAEANELSVEGTSFRSGVTTQRPHITHIS